MQRELFEEAKSVLNKLVTCLRNLNSNDYTKPIPILGNSTVGEHTRHVIEFFQCLSKGYESGEFNYDDRKRELLIQTSSEFAIECISTIISELHRPNKDLILTSHFLKSDDVIVTNYRRELHYNIEHCIHHQAIIKIGLMALGVTNVDKNFGVSNATMKYREIEI